MHSAALVSPVVYDLYDVVVPSVNDADMWCVFEKIGRV